MVRLRKIILITGTPGVGKTSISKVLVKRLNALRIDLNELVFKDGLFLNMDEKRDTKVADLDKLSKRVKTVLKSTSKDIIIESHYASDVLPPNLVTHIFVIRRNPKFLINILEKKGFSPSKVKENVLAELLDVCLINAISSNVSEKVSEVDATNHTIKEVTDEIIQIIKGLKRKNFGNIDWIQRLEDDKLLRDLLESFCSF